MKEKFQSAMHGVWAEVPLNDAGPLVDAEGGLKFQNSVAAIVPRYFVAKDYFLTKDYFFAKEEVWPQSPVMTNSARLFRTRGASSRSLSLSGRELGSPG